MRVRSWIRRAWAANRWLTLSAIGYLVLLPIYIAAAILDPRVITGMPAMVKPLKFIISTGIYSATFVWLLTYVQGYRRWKLIAANMTALGFLVENAIITAQAVRGVTSHFNAATPLDTALYGIMGNFVIVIALCNLLLAILLLRQRLPNPILAWGLRLGMAAALAGMAIAPIMTSQASPSQAAAIQAGETPSTFGAHSVGVDDGGPGLPVVGWSTTGGDLRIPHFVGLHGMQVLPFLAWLLMRPALHRRYSAGRRTAFLAATGVAYLGWVALLTWQALRGQPIVAPDAWTWITYAGLAGAWALASVAILWRADAPTDQAQTAPAA